MSKYKIVLIAEIHADSHEDACSKLDAFREAARPSEEYGIVLYQPRRKRRDMSLLLDKLEQLARFSP